MRLLTLFTCILLFSCQSERQAKSVEAIPYSKFSGSTMGTSYNIQCDLQNADIKAQIDSILIDINSEVSTYEKESYISKLNRSSASDIPVASEVRMQTLPKAKHFTENFTRSKEIYKNTDGYFDPTVMPLVNYWGFGYTPKQKVTDVDSSRIQEILESVGFDKWTFSDQDSVNSFIKHKNSEIDFSAIAKGYAVDYISSYLENQGAQNYMVEIGGELYTRGLNSKGQAWTIGLNKPEEDAALNDFAVLVQFSNKALASSGNYRNFYVSNGKKFAHEINPKTGFPEFNDLLGVSVIADNCMDADAYATAFMIMGLDRSKEKIEQIDGIEACFFFSDEEGQIQYVLSSGFDPYIKS